MEKLGKKNKVSYSLLTSAEDGEFFYAKLGRFFCSKEVTQEFLGYQVVDSPLRKWVVGFNKDQAVCFASFDLARAEQGIIMLCDAYVDPEYRLKGIYRDLFKLRLFTAARLALTPEFVVKGIALEVSLKIFLENGFIKKSQRGRFSYMEKTYREEQ